jgi:hypothetical protein
VSCVFVFEVEREQPTCRLVSVEKAELSRDRLRLPTRERTVRREVGLSRRAAFTRPSDA